MENSESGNGEFDPDEMADTVLVLKASEVQCTKAAKKTVYKLKLTYRCQC